MEKLRSNICHCGPNEGTERALPLLALGDVADDSRRLPLVPNPHGRDGKLYRELAPVLSQGKDLYRLTHNWPCPRIKEAIKPLPRLLPVPLRHNNIVQILPHN